MTKLLQHQLRQLLLLQYRETESEVEVEADTALQAGTEPAGSSSSSSNQRRDWRVDVDPSLDPETARLRGIRVPTIIHGPELSLDSDSDLNLNSLSVLPFDAQSVGKPYPATLLAVHLPDDANDAMLHALFSPFGPIASMRLVRPPGSSAPIASITFAGSALDAGNVARAALMESLQSDTFKGIVLDFDQDVCKDS
eukprot:jgi/Hompol1/3312/HPOL_000545-RA